MMKNTLLIHFHANGQVNWARFDKRQQLVAQQDDSETTLTPQAGGKVVVLVPSSSVLMTEAVIPSRQMRRIRQAVPYALEEQVAADIDTLHFALAEKSAAGRVPTAVIANITLQEWLDRLQQQGLSPDQLIPEVCAVPLPAEGWGIMLFASQGIVRTGVYSGFAIELDNLTLALQLVMQEETVVPPSQLTIYQGMSQAESNSTTVTQQSTMTALHGLGIPIHTEAHALGKWHWFTMGLTATKPLNLLQAAYQPMQISRNQWQPWRLTLGLGLALGTVMLVQQWLTYQQLQQQRTALNTQIRQIYQATFPDARRIVNPRVQMQQQLTALRQQATQHTEPVHFLSVLAQLSPILQRIPNLQIKRLTYRNQQFDLSVTLNSLQTLEQLQQQLQAQQFVVTLQNATSQAEQVEARLRIGLPR